MKPIRLSSTPTFPGRFPRSSWVLFAYDQRVLYPPGLPALKRQVEDWVRRVDFDGSRFAVTGFLPSGLPADMIVLCGLGKKEDFFPGLFEKAAATVSRFARAHKLEHLVFAPTDILDQAGLGPREGARLAARGVYAGRYRFHRFRSGKEPDEPRAMVLCGPSAELQPGLRIGEAEGRVLSEIRDLANLPANELHPSAVAAAARVLARRYGVACRVYDKRQIERKGLKAFLAMSRGSRQDARLIELRYPGTRTGLKPVVLVGKTVTFDSGGISLKPPKNMEWMKYDKSGGMAALAAILILARLKTPRPVTVYLAAAENMPGGNATRPGDIVRSYAGKTIDILNTDAEGRLLLADTLALAAESRPAAMIDIATLTGAVIVALGHTAAAVLSNRNDLRDRLIAAGERSGDRLWPLPLWPDYDADLKDPFADLKNVGDGSAGTIVGAAFLKQFVPPDIPWAHLDIAGVAWEEKERPYADPGATLAGARLLVEWVRSMDDTPTK